MKKSKTIVSPSLLSADFYNLEKEITLIKEGGATWLHYDVMDGHFVPNLTIGVPVVKTLAKKTGLFNDVHIMIEDPYTYGPIFAAAGADLVTFHYEALKSNEEVIKTIEVIKKAGAKVGISIKPKTNVEEIYKFLPLIDLVLIMSVEPGFGGQSFIESSLEKADSLRKEIDKNNYKVLIEIDGGINFETAKKAVDSGVNVLVAGSFLFGQKDIKERLKYLLSL